jgi:hypothetical protein
MMVVSTTSLALITIDSFLGVGAPAAAATRRECRAAGSPYVAEVCSGLRPQKVAKCALPKALAELSR